MRGGYMFSALISVFFLVAKINSQSSYSHAADFVGLAPAGSFECLVNRGYSAVFIRIFEAENGGKIDGDALENIQNARKAKLDVELFATLNVTARGAKEQVGEIIDFLKAQQIHMKSLWIQLTNPIQWPADHYQNAMFLIDAVTTLHVSGIIPGIYTSIYDSMQILGFRTNEADHNQSILSSTLNQTDGPHDMKILMWYWNTNGEGDDGESPPNFSDYRPIMLIPQPTVKQFAQAEWICGMNINRSAYGFLYGKNGENLRKKGFPRKHGKRQHSEV